MHGNIKHGDAPLHGKPSVEYNSWANMVQRCTNPKNPKYPRYGGRGITICERWMDYRNFLADMGRKPSPEHTVDRIDNNGNYEPSNCRWATGIEQCNNTRRNRWVEYAGMKLSVTHWARMLGVGRDRLHYHIYSGKSMDSFIDQLYAEVA